MGSCVKGVMCGGVGIGEKKYMRWFGHMEGKYMRVKLRVLGNIEG